MSERFNPGYTDQKGILVLNFGGPAYGGLIAAGTTVPADPSAGYSKGAIFFDTDAAAGAQLWTNTGTVASSAFRAVLYDGMTVTALTVATLTATTVVTDAINMAAAAGVITVKANTAHSLEVTDATTIVIDVDTRNTLKNVHSVTLTGVPVTVATEAAVHQNSTLNLAAKTITYSGTATVTSSYGAQLYLGIPTFTDASAGTITDCSTMHVAAVATAGGSLTLTARKMISTGVADAYLTNAGVWTDTACWSYGKKHIGKAAKKARSAIEGIIEQIVPKTWEYRKSFTVTGADGVKTEMGFDDHGRKRVGVVYDDLPDELRAPGEERGVSTGVLSSFALAALKLLWDENKDLKARVARLEGA